MGIKRNNNKSGEVERDGGGLPVQTTSNMYLSAESAAMIKGLADFFLQERKSISAKASDSAAS